MARFLLHGCYDAVTFQTLLGLGVHDFAFDLRGRSPHLIPYRELDNILTKFAAKLSEEIYLVFENDRPETISSFLNLLQRHPFQFIPLLRDNRDPEYYRSLNQPSLWMFHPEGHWSAILKDPQLRGVLLPLSWQSRYKSLPELWEIVEDRNLKVFLHASHSEEVTNLGLQKELNVSLELTKEMECGFRTIDQDRLKKMTIWRSNENIAIQR
jgi:hypothetical protein